MITLRILLSPGRRGRIVDASGRSVPQPLPAPVIGSAEPLRIILLDPATLDPADPYGFDTGAPLRLTISGDWDPATIPVYATNALVRSGVGTYDLADPSGTRTAEALALLGVLAERLCAWELTAYGGDPATEADWAHPLSVVQFDAPLRQRADSLGGDPAEAPAVDLRGPAGKDGTSATVAVGKTTTLPAGSPAAVRNVGTDSAAVLDFDVPGTTEWTYNGAPTITPDAADPTIAYAPFYKNTVVDCYASAPVETFVPAYHPTADCVGSFCIYRIGNDTQKVVGITTSVGNLIATVGPGACVVVQFYCTSENVSIPLLRCVGSY